MIKTHQCIIEALFLLFCCKISMGTGLKRQTSFTLQIFDLVKSSIHTAIVSNLIVHCYSWQGAQRKESKPCNIHNLWWKTNYLCVCVCVYLCTYAHVYLCVWLSVMCGKGAIQPFTASFCIVFLLLLPPPPKKRRRL